MRKHNKERTLRFVDFRKAFDSISRQAIFDILLLYGIPEPIVEAIKSLYNNTEATVITPDGETEFFEITAGVLQGDILAPFIFMIVLDFRLRLSLDNLNDRGLQIQPRRSRRHPAQQLTDLYFADDLALITVEDAEALLHSLERAAALIRLYCNVSKTEYINTTEGSHNLKSLSGGTIKRVQDFKYLGAWILDSEKDFKVRKLYHPSCFGTKGSLFSTERRRTCKHYRGTRALRSVKWTRQCGSEHCCTLLFLVSRPRMSKDDDDDDYKGNWNS